MILSLLSLLDNARLDIPLLPSCFLHQAALRQESLARRNSYSPEDTLRCTGRAL